MRRRILLLTPAVLWLGACATLDGEEPAPAPSISDILQGDHATPGALDLLETLEHELRIARRHGGFAARKPDDIRWIKTQLRHLRHALDPASEPDGPGLGYGVVRAGSTAERLLAEAEGLGTLGPERIAELRRHRRALRRVVDRANEALILSANVILEPKLSPRVVEWLVAVNGALESADRRLQITRLSLSARR